MSARAETTVWLSPSAASFACLCETCLVHGTLRQDADVGFTTCRRGHRIVVRRVARALARVG